MKSALIITTYNWSEALELVLLSITKQTILPDEVIIADDGSKSQTKILIEKYQKIFSIPLYHFWQEDNQFRAASARNGAIRLAHSEYLIFIDGDMILHPSFIADHLSFSKQGTFLQGSRVLIDKVKTRQILQDKNFPFSFLERGFLNRKNAIHSHILAKLYSQYRTTIKGIKTCNFSLYLCDAYKVNGFNEDFIGWGREDSEFAVRLMNAGIHRKDIKFHAIAYHLYHAENTRDSLSENHKRLQEAIENNKIWCESGLK